jgi:hypothetical protein
LIGFGLRFFFRLFFFHVPFTSKLIAWGMCFDRSSHKTSIMQMSGISDHLMDSERQKRSSLTARQNMAFHMDLVKGQDTVGVKKIYCNKSMNREWETIRRF